MIDRPPYRARTYPVDLPMLLVLFKEMQAGEYVTATGLPFDARLVGAAHDSLRNRYLLFVESDTFDPVPEGEVPPEIFIEFTLNGIPREE